MPSTDFPRTSRGCTVCEDCHTGPCDRQDCGLLPALPTKAETPAELADENIALRGRVKFLYDRIRLQQQSLATQRTTIDNLEAQLKAAHYEVAALRERLPK